MNFIKKHKIKIIILAVAAVLLSIAWVKGGSVADNKAAEKKVATENITAEPEEDFKPAENRENVKEKEKEEEEESSRKTFDAKKTASEGESENSEPAEILMETQPVSEKEEKADDGLNCTLSVECSAVLENMDSLKKEKRNIIPADGIIFPEQKVVFYEGESVFNVLVREMKKNKIHLEFVNTPGTGGSYIEGIANLYEFDCGELSGWKYRVNGEYPGLSSSMYKLKDGDKIEWVYALELEDIT